MAKIKTHSSRSQEVEVKTPARFNDKRRPVSQETYEKPKLYNS